METFSVGMSEIVVRKGAAKFLCLGLGSCIGVAIYDPKADVSGMIHVMLPAAFPDRPVEQIGKFADTGIPALLMAMEKMGANKRNMKVAIAGGAQVFKFNNTGTNQLDIGRRNGEAVIEQLTKAGLKILAKDIGGSHGRTVTFTVPDGKVEVKTLSQGVSELCNLADNRERSAA